MLEITTDYTFLPEPNIRVSTLSLSGLIPSFSVMTRIMNKIDVSIHATEFYINNAHDK